MDVLAEEGRARPRKASGSCQEALIRRCPNGGNPLRCKSEVPRYAGDFLIFNFQFSNEFSMTK